MLRVAECSGAGNKRGPRVCRERRLAGLGFPGGHLEPGPLGRTAPPPGVEGFPFGDVLLCVTLTIPLGKKKEKERETQSKKVRRCQKWGHAGQPGLMHLSQEPVNQGGGHGGESCCSVQRPGVEEIGMGRALKQGHTNCLAASFPGGRKAGRASRGSQAPEEAKRSS